MHVKEIMDPKHPFIHEHELATKARAMIREFGLRILPATNEDKQLVGKVSRRDIMIISSSVSSIRVKGLMTPPKHVATVDDDVSLAIKKMLRVDAWSAPVVSSSQDRTYVGVVGLEHFIEPAMKTTPEKLLKDVSEIMVKNPLSCSPDDEVDNIWRLMYEKRLAGLPVTDMGRLVGIVTQKDLLSSGTFSPTFESTKGRFRSPPKISAVMQTNVESVRPDMKLIKAARVMIRKNVGRVPVTDKDGKLVGIIDREDIVRAGSL